MRPGEVTSDARPGSGDHMGDAELDAIWTAMTDMVLTVSRNVNVGVELAAGVSPVEFAVLSRLCRSPHGVVPLRDLAVDAKVSAAGFDRVVERLQRSEVIQVRRIESEPGSCEAVMTDLGRTAASAARVQYLADLRAHLHSKLGTEATRVLGASARTVLHGDSAH